MTAAPIEGDLTDYAFVASRQSSEIAVISVPQDKVIATLKLEAVPSQIVVSETSERLVATHVETDQVSVVDLKSGRLIKTLDPGVRPDIMKLEDGVGMLAVGAYGGEEIALISLDDTTVHAAIDGLAPIGDLMFGRDGKHLFIARRDAGTIDVADVRRGVIADRIILEDVDIGIRNLVRTPGGKAGLALHGESGLLSALDLEDAVQVGRSRLPGPTLRGFPSANSQYFLIPNGAVSQDDDVGTMSMVSSWTYQEADRLPAPTHLTGINFAMFDTVALAFDQTGRSAMNVSLVDEAGPRRTRIPLPGTPETALTVDAGKRVYVALSDTDQVAVIDARRGELAGLIDDVGDEPWAITAAGGLGYCH